MVNSTTKRYQKKKRGANFKKKSLGTGFEYCSLIGQWNNPTGNECLNYFWWFFTVFGVIEPSEHYGTNFFAYFWLFERHITYIFPKIGIFPLYNPSQAKSADWKRRKTEAEEKPEDKVEESEEVDAIDDPMSWYFNWTIDQSADNLEIAKESIQQVPQHMAHILWLIIMNSLRMTHHLWLIIFDSSFMTHHLWLIWFIFYK